MVMPGSALSLGSGFCKKEKPLTQIYRSELGRHECSRIAAGIKAIQR